MYPLLWNCQHHLEPLAKSDRIKETSVVKMMQNWEAPSELPAIFLLRKSSPILYTTESHGYYYDQKMFHFTI